MKTVGLKSLDFFHICTSTNLKNDLLYFDEIIIDQEHFEMCSDMVNSTESGSLKEKLDFSINEIEFLEKKGLVKIENTKTVFANVISTSELDLIDFPSDYVLKDKSKTKSQEDIKNELLAQMHLDNVESNLNARKICSKLNEKNIFNVKPIIEIRMENHPNFPDFSPLFKNKLSKNTDIANLVLRKTPLINDNVSWEEIIDFRSNNDLNIYRLGIINWISEMGNSNLNIYEIEQKLDYLLIQYEERLKKEKIKYKIGNAELVVTTSLMVLENIVKLNWSKAAKSLFDLKRKSIDLMIGETLAPGREVAYISKIKELNK